MKSLLAAVLLLVPLAAPAADCPSRPFVAGGPEIVPPIARVILFWPRGKADSAPSLTVRESNGHPLPFSLQRLWRGPVWNVYSLTVVAGADTDFRVDGDAGHPELKSSFHSDPHWKSSGPAPAYRIEWKEGGRKKTAVLPAESECFPWPKGAKATGLLADGGETP
ncbi:MAG: hypothetical protein HY923_03245 [Elusimicrobia bacterium]|nr:hypothetical protein [Elusimicrobiota bacterium]